MYRTICGTIYIICGSIHPLWGGGDRGAGSMVRSSGGREEMEVFVERKGNWTQEPRSLTFCSTAQRPT